MTTVCFIAAAIILAASGLALIIRWARRPPQPEHTERSTPDPVAVTIAVQARTIRQLEKRLEYTEAELEAARLLLRAKPHTSTIRIAMMSPGGDA